VGESGGLLGYIMSLARADLPDDPDALRAFVFACQAELKAAELSVQLRTLVIEKLKFQIAKLRRMQFGRSAERITRQTAGPRQSD
jgi:transposase